MSKKNNSDIKAVVETNIEKPVVEVEETLEQKMGKKFISPIEKQMIADELASHRIQSGEIKVVPIINAPIIADKKNANTSMFRGNSILL